MLLLVNGEDSETVFRLSRRASVLRWERLLDTWIEGVAVDRRRFWKRGESYTLRERSVALFRGVPRRPRGTRRRDALQPDGGER